MFWGQCKKAMSLYIVITIDRDGFTLEVTLHTIFGTAKNSRLLTHCNPHTYTVYYTERSHLSALTEVSPN